MCYDCIYCTSLDLASFCSFRENSVASQNLISIFQFDANKLQWSHSNDTSSVGQAYQIFSMHLSWEFTGNHDQSTLKPTTTANQLAGHSHASPVRLEAMAARCWHWISTFFCCIFLILWTCIILNITDLYCKLLKCSKVDKSAYCLRSKTPYLTQMKTVKMKFE